MLARHSLCQKLAKSLQLYIAACSVHRLKPELRGCIVINILQWQLIFFLLQSMTFIWFLYCPWNGRSSEVRTVGSVSLVPLAYLNWQMSSTEKLLICR